MRLALKILIVAGLSLAILLPLLLIRGVIHDRQRYRAEAVAQIGRSEAGGQALAAPVLVVPYTETVEVEEKDANGRPLGTVLRERQRQWLFFPTTMDMAGTLAPYSRRLGLHEVRMYALGGQMKAAFDVRIPDEENAADSAAARRIGRPFLSYGIADVRGLRGTPRLRIDDAAVALQQGAGGDMGSGLHVELGAVRPGQRLRLSSVFDFALAGTESLAVMPLAGENRVVVDSPWPHPQFNGRFLPTSREIGSDGFRADWAISSLASDAQRQYRNGGRIDRHTAPMLLEHGSADLDLLGISLVDPVDAYLRADRASKYGILFVLLTFTGFFMFELLQQLRIHPVQYALVGLALAIFFLLLVSLSERIAFGWAYLVASVACVGLLGAYLVAVLRSRAWGIGFTALLALLYAALYGLLVSEDNALVLGAGLLFVILAAIMLATRRVDWYQVAAASPGPAPAPPPLPAR
ncbi:cell envelope integrity protein CreD [Luteimonas sp. BDR2-5]|uniref:cell envelope integrity protein CreD n=1 Tax=Proluteimonas luteida TaxID=2878685 RepID=UPI001E470D2D|nr:cell envelope integrity protein CreD [Luteimonas sp. BDR2-5]MCD9027600.1 cell envelope integrity protein CreD [Luteimonas sp. BDR2-5]